MKIKRRLSLALRFVFLLAVKALTVFFPKKPYRGIWLFSERGFDACDNAWVLFCYVRRTAPERRVYYILSKEAECCARVGETGPVLRKGSLRHQFLYFLPTVKISTHIFGTAPDGEIMNSRAGRRFLGAQGKTVFLQHGVLTNDIPALYASHTDLSLFVCSAETEYQFVRERFGYPEGVVRCPGLARFDLLTVSRPLRQILFMPTWRTALCGLPENVFAESSYFSAVNEVLKSKALEALLARYRMRMIFTLHPEMRRFEQRFSASNEWIRMETGDIGSLVRSSALLITDFSSVMFDFAYMRRPVIYFLAAGLDISHYPPGYFDRERDGFGEVIYDMDGLLRALDRILSQDCQMPAVYAARAEAFFPVRDTENCRRNAEAILDLVETQENL